MWLLNRSAFGDSKEFVPTLCVVGINQVVARAWVYRARRRFTQQPDLL
jgi:hypothetical protein